MINQETFDKIKNLAEESIEDIYYAIAEEFGELGLALHVRNGTKQRELKESAEIECVDTILCLIELYIRLGGTYEDFNKTVERKLKKWVVNNCDHSETIVYPDYHGAYYDRIVCKKCKKWMT